MKHACLKKLPRKFFIRRKFCEQNRQIFHELRRCPNPCDNFTDRWSRSCQKRPRLLQIQITKIWQTNHCHACGGFHITTTVHGPWLTSSQPIQSHVVWLNTQPTWPFDKSHVTVTWKWNTQRLQHSTHVNTKYTAKLHLPDMNTRLTRPYLWHYMQLWIHRKTKLHSSTPDRVRKWGEDNYTSNTQVLHQI